MANWTNVTVTTNQKQLDNLFAGTDYEWRVRSVCDGQRAPTSAWSNRKTFTTTGFGLHATAETMPGNDRSFKVNPNPVVQSATISFSLPESSLVTITAFDANGRKLKVITSHVFAGGNHSINFNREKLAVGMYYLQLKTNSDTMMKKIVVE